MKCGLRYFLKHPSVLDKTIDLIETARLEELSLLQTFDVIKMPCFSVNYSNFLSYLDHRN